MKKSLLIAALAVLTSVGAYAQGYFQFTSSTRAVWDDWSTAIIPKADASNNVAFLINWNNTGSPAVASALQTAIETNHTATIDGATAWNAILNDPNFHFATNATTGQMVISQASAAGAIAYNSSASFPVVGTSATGGTIDVYVIAWSYMYANPFLAAAANSPVGWSIEFSYTYGTSISTLSSFSTAAGANFPFGVAPVPEPTTLALLGLGSASLMIFRRRKS